MKWMMIAAAVLAFGIHAEESEAKKDVANDAAFHSALLNIAKEYASYGRVDDEARWAPYLCRTPNPSVARISASKDSDTHGSKLYFLFVKQRDAYLKLGEQSVQVIVKEGWTPKEVPPDTKTVAQPGEHYVPFAKKDGKVFHADSKSALFIMYKLDPKTAGTDDGWVYGTVTSDGKTVTSAGRVSSCMGCHQEAKVDRLFGLSHSK